MRGIQQLRSTHPKATLLDIYLCLSSIDHLASQACLSRAVHKQVSELWAATTADKTSVERELAEARRRERKLLDLLEKVQHHICEGSVSEYTHEEIMAEINEALLPAQPENR